MQKVYNSRLASARAWVDPETLPPYLSADTVAGNAPARVKQLTLNTLGAYGVGNEDCFARVVGQRIRIREMDVVEHDARTDVVVVADLQASKGMLNGAGTVHGGCLAYLIDSCSSFPLIALGLLKDVNGVGVTQAMNVFYHAPASIDTCLRITSTSMTLGKRIMTTKCEVTDKETGRLIASGLLSKMQPPSGAQARL
ncbi:HotDog domain-containing protein [Trametes elegans]|nr:HotDog domain-containing protein [Trametes elegans]